jgi:predicted ATPase
MQSLAGQALALGRVFSSICLSVMGRLEEARRHGGEALAQARRINHSRTTALVLIYTAMACQFRREVQETARYANEVIASERSDWIWHSWVRVIQGWSLAEQGQSREGLALVQQEIAHRRGKGARFMMTYYLSVLAELHWKGGRVREGLAVVDAALEEARETGERGDEAELHRLHGELLRASGREDEARPAFFRAIRVARKQEALLFELRATVALGRLLRDTERPEAARKRLTRVLARFEDGVDSVDLLEARGLLAQLSGGEPPGVMRP